MLTTTLDDVLKEFSERFPTYFIRSLNAEFQVKFKNHGKHFKVHKYEIVFLNFLMKSIVARKFIRSFGDALSGSMNLNLERDFTDDNLISHHRLVKQGLIKAYSSAFLYDQVVKCFAEQFGSFMKSASHVNSYRGNYLATFHITRSIFLSCYQDSCDVVAERLMQHRDGDDVERGLAKVPSGPLQFSLKGDKFSYTAPEIRRDRSPLFDEIIEEFDLLGGQVARLGNRFPRFLRIIRRYENEVRKDKPDPLLLFLYGGELQSYVNRNDDLFHSSLMKADPEDEPRDLLDGLDSILIRHGLIIMSSSNIQEIVNQQEKITNLDYNSKERDDAFRPYRLTVASISRSERLFDDKTRSLAANVSEVDEGGRHGGAQEAVAAAVTSGALAGFGKFAKEISKDIIKDEIKSQIKEVKSSEKRNEIKNYIAEFIKNRSAELAEIAARHPASLGWIASVLRYFGAGS